MSSDTLFTWDALATMAGASLLVYFIVQYTKALMDRWAPKLPTDVYAVAVSFVVLTFAQIATGANPSDWRLYGLTFANAFLVAAAAGQINNKAISPPGASSGSQTTAKEDATQ